MTNYMVTGGTGTFGREFVRTLMNSMQSPDRIVVYSRDEQKQHHMAAQFGQDKKNSLRFFIGDVRDEDRLSMAMKGVDVVIHAAAMKIVPTCEYDPCEAVKTNIGGTMSVINSVLRPRGDVSKVLLISTDKAVAPINLYGSTKLCAEKLVVAANNLSGQFGPEFSVVRYGNVAGSRGSVIPLWKLRALAKQPLPITDLKMTRFWITIQDAVKFVVGALEVMSGGEIFIPRMPSFRISDLCAAVYGAACIEECPHDVIGVRPGEKLHEDMITVHEAVNGMANEYAYVICPPWAPPSINDRLPHGFSLSSNKNQEWLTIADLAELIKDDDHE